MMKDLVINTIKKHNLIKKGQHIVVGLSGGPDSVCLFYVLKELSEEFNLTLYAAHINHKLRPGAAEEDQAYVENLCKEEGIECFSFVVDCDRMAREGSMTCEEAGRQARYSSFAQVCAKLEKRGIKKENIRIAIAHNKEDQAETVLFRIIRGTGTDGLAGISYKRKDRFGNTIIRPLLDINRATIEEYCHENGLNPRIDKTNEQPLYTRNKIRLSLIPFLRENFNDNIVDSLTRLSIIAADDKDALWSRAEKAYSEAAVGKLTFDLDILKRQERAVLHRVYSMALVRLGLDEDVTMAHYELVDELVYDKMSKPSAMVNLPKGITASKLYDKLTFVKKEDVVCEAPKFSISVLSREKWDKTSKEEVYAAYDMDKINSEYKMTSRGVENLGISSIVKIRPRAEGDYIRLKNAGRKKIQDFLVDEKVPKMYRGSVYVAAIGSEVLWILPYKGFTSDTLRRKGRFSGNYLIDSNTNWVLYIEKNV